MKLEIAWKSMTIIFELVGHFLRRTGSLTLGV